ncbi:MULTISPECIES: hypothetical protein [Streptomyces]|uniref:Uncharacterized protein n=1 Tax=Streptomyces albus (strain ATCC 21838 / DSM 41398 / FERM P-419 / JCM 4703 / NBRC 107858) TaxID=1081613 RepID=A0A0B5F5M7_STRA4|nr:hypothetical protein [Streptomyces sp. SCSIO ZS0520]AJE85672.1 hypothetical protein SLNWT_5296 [Streptomyces albus]AOU79974.1 hypothetical protein SLNHY_5283 [Streptomyces albus]AYN35691.1 hypothetical protein DUI70_5195 [Streptomyces albus]
MHDAHPVLLATDTAAEQGAGNLLRVVIVVSVLGAVLLAWLLLRGYRDRD